MMDFLVGQNSTIMTYGTTNSGKSYTLQGTTTSPGIIPRCLEFVFSNITPKSTPSYKPMNHCDVVCMDPLERAQELEIKSKLLSFASIDKHHYTTAYKEMQKLLEEESPIRPSQCIDAHYSVWVSFAEIYNEVVYDLLSNESQKKRTPLKLATDSQSRAFIKGLKTVCVNSGSEAYQVLMAGQYNLKVAATALNARSSRSHCIFTIKLLKYYIENDPSSVEVSTFAFCDLAGSERLKKTLNIGDRLKEAQNINTSLMVLGRCLKTIHKEQITKQKIEQIGPFRESKLTRLFQKALSGKEHIALIVNINPVPNLYIETQSVLNFSAIAKKIVIEEKEKVQKRSKSRFTQIVSQSIKTVTDWDATELESAEWQNTDDGNVIMPNYVHAEDYNELMSENKRLKKEIVILKNSALSHDLEIRQEMADTYMAMIKELEKNWTDRIRNVEKEQENVLMWSVKRVEEFYKQKFDSRKRTRTLDDDEEDTEELKIQNSQLISKVKQLKDSKREVESSNKSLIVENNKVTFELGLVKEDLKSVKTLLKAVQQDICLNEDTKCYIEELETQLFAKQEQAKKLKVFLNEAKEEYITISTEVMEKDHLIKEQEEELFEKQETIDDLEADLGNINICLTEKTKVVEMLEKELDSQNKKIIDSDNKLHDMQTKVQELQNEKCLLQDEIELLKKATSIRTSTKHDEIVVQQEFLSVFDLEILDKAGENNEKDIKIENYEFDPQIGEKIIAIETENSTLKEKLTQSSTEIQSLKEELDSAKVKLKDISDQICNLQVSSTKSTVKNDVPIAIETTEIGCQVLIQDEEEQTDTIENDVHNKSSQTIKSTTTEGISQTSFIDENEDYDFDLEALAKLIVKYDDTKLLYKKKCSILKEVEEEVLSLKQMINNLSDESNTNKVIIEEYKKSIDLLQDEISVIKDSKAQLEQTLQNSNSDKTTLETKINDYEQRLNEAEKELSLTKKDYDHCTEKLNTLQQDFDSHVSKCKNEHEQIIDNLQKELSVATEKCDIKSECLDVHVSKVTELEHRLESVTELQQQIEEINRKLEICQDEKEHLRRLLDETNDKLLEVEDQLEHADEKERDKDMEIISLQKELKYLIQKSENNDRSDNSDKLMETEMKNTIKHLNETKEMLLQREEHIKCLQERLKMSEQNAIVLNVLQQSNQERQAENDRLRNLNVELKNSLVEKEREMESFMKNRDEMVTMYESLVKNQQEELGKQKRRGATKGQKASKEKNNCENTSEDEVASKGRRIRRPPKRYMMSPNDDEISVIDLSGSETKRTGKYIPALPPPTQMNSEKKKTIRRKKLYVSENDSAQDIEPVESPLIIPPSPMPASLSKVRNLRNKRK
ncbi:kinesin-like protein KIF20B isoform X2 [Colletes gigas]|nr:kinesin-like protein KIF20B isoform X2 [Colletes gigas]